MKDFIQLNTPAPHFKRFCRLATFIVRVHLIRENYRQEASDPIKSKYFAAVKYIHLSEATNALIEQLVGLEFRSTHDDTD